MRNKDWSLVLFTILSQLSVGIVLWLVLLVFSSTHTGELFETGFGFKNPILLALALIGIATISSFLHLGNPKNAPNAMNNLSSSWLSREIMAINIYVLSLLASFVLGWFSANVEILKCFLLLNSLAGLALLWMMIRVYAIPTIPSWNNWYTPLSFGSSAVCLGLLAMLVLTHFGMVIVSDSAIQWSLVFLMLVLLVETASVWFHQMNLEKMQTGFDGPEFHAGTFKKLFLARTGMLIITFVAVFILIIQTGFIRGDSYFPWIYPLLLLIVAQEILGRLLFYSSYFRVGV